MFILVCFLYTLPNLLGNVLVRVASRMTDIQNQSSEAILNDLFSSFDSKNRRKILELGGEGTEDEDSDSEESIENEDGVSLDYVLW